MNGTVASFFTYWSGPNWQMGKWNEIDVEIVPSMQLQGISPFSTNIIYGGGDGTNYNIQEQAYEPYNQNYDQFHEWTIIWTPDYV